MNIHDALHDAIKTFQNAWHDFVNHAEQDVVAFATPAIAVIAQNGGKILLGLAEQVLNAEIAGTPWKDNIAALISAAEAQGLTLLENAASAALNMAKANLDAKAGA